jgi:hypothetical protein
MYRVVTLCDAANDDAPCVSFRGAVAFARGVSGKSGVLCTARLAQNARETKCDQQVVADIFLPTPSMPPFLQEGEEGESPNLSSSLKSVFVDEKMRRIEEDPFTQNHYTPRTREDKLHPHYTPPHHHQQRALSPSPLHRERDAHEEKEKNPNPRDARAAAAAATTSDLYVVARGPPGPRDLVHLRLELRVFKDEVSLAALAPAAGGARAVHGVHVEVEVDVAALLVLLRAHRSVGGTSCDPNVKKTNFEKPGYHHVSGFYKGCETRRFQAQGQVVKPGRFRAPGPGCETIALSSSRVRLKLYM